MVNGDEILSHTHLRHLLHLQNTNFHTLIYCLMMNIILHSLTEALCLCMEELFILFRIIIIIIIIIIKTQKKLNIQRILFFFV